MMSSKPQIIKKTPKGIGYSADYCPDMSRMVRALQIFLGKEVNHTEKRIERGTRQPDQATG